VRSSSSTLTIDFGYSDPDSAESPFEASAVSSRRVAAVGARCRLLAGALGLSRAEPDGCPGEAGRPSTVEAAEATGVDAGAPCVPAARAARSGAPARRSQVGGCSRSSRPAPRPRPKIASPTTSLRPIRRGGGGASGTASAARQTPAKPGLRGPGRRGRRSRGRPRGRNFRASSRAGAPGSGSEPIGLANTVVASSSPQNWVASSSVQFRRTVEGTGRSDNGTDFMGDARQ
jgi:hypothetical protein